MDVIGWLGGLLLYKVYNSCEKHLNQINTVIYRANSYISIGLVHTQIQSDNLSIGGCV
jgi:hypothetical protein